MLIILKFIITTYLVHCFILGPLNNAWTVNSKHSIGICGRKEEKEESNCPKGQDSS